ncbi:hypothetical protein PG985_012662 [Apiospora marii]|uniref:Actin-like ATPase domain-containing protein n=1 Tax=Apiospora marii TaxID=335849 RepID=A0ABR1RD05_9PEZI
MPPSRQNNNRKKGVIGLDVGTTFSGASYGLTGTRSVSNRIEVEVVRGWPRADGFGRSDNQKVPTQLHYGVDGSIRWGYNIPDDAKRLEWFKLHFSDKAKLPKDVQNSPQLKKSQEMLDEMGIDADTAMAEYLKRLWNHTIEQFRRHRGAGLVDSIPFIVVLTVPAIWTETARKRMREAAKRAGILDDRLPGVTKLQFISEPEAAAISSLYSELDDRPDVKKGTRFIVLDCGGGTVDLISYEVVQVTPEIKVKECTTGIGGLCGATFLDQAFSEYFLNIVDRRTWDRYSKSQQNEIMDKEWEKKIKRDFSTTNTAPCIMHMPNGPITLRKKEVSNVFKKAMRPILGMVNDQINSMAGEGDEILEEDMPKFIILVGGYGRCSFLYDYLQKELDEDIDILQSQGSRPWSAICRGAVLSVIKRKSLVGPVLQRKARQSYGWTVEEDWDPKQHTDGVDEKKFDDVRGKNMAVNQFHWGIKAGDDINSNVMSNPYHFAFPLGKKGHYKYHADIYKTQSPNLPTRLVPEDHDVQRVGGLDLDFPVRIEDLPTRNNEQGEVIQVLDYVTKSTVNGDSFDIWAEYNGSGAGKLELEIDVSEHADKDDGR